MTEQMPLSHLGLPRAIPSLARRKVESLGSQWGYPDSASWIQLWADIEVVAQEFLAQVADHQQGSAVDASWHHLLMGIGNFKRSAGHIMDTPPLEPSGPTVDQLRFLIPGTALIVDSDEPQSWSHLTDAVRGLGVPTATTLLSALWPGRHVIVDVRTTRAAVGLGAGLLWNAEEYDDARLPDRGDDSRYWDFYRRWYRETVLSTFQSRPVLAERSLYVLDRKTMDKLEPEWVEVGTWTQYRQRAETLLADI